MSEDEKTLPEKESSAKVESETATSDTGESQTTTPQPKTKAENKAKARSKDSEIGDSETGDSETGPEAAATDPNGSNGDGSNGDDSDEDEELETASEEGDSSRGQEAEIMVTEKFVSKVNKALKKRNIPNLAKLLEPLHIADVADLIEALEQDKRQVLFDLAGSWLNPDFLGYLPEHVRDDVVELLGPERLAKALRELASDDAVYVVEDLDEEFKHKILSSLPASERTLLEQGLSYPEDSAGRLMQREFVAVAPFWSVGETIDFMRVSKDLPDDFYDIFVIDPSFRPIGSVPISRLLRAGRPTKVADIMSADPKTVHVELDQEEAAYFFRQYGLVEAPVVDDAGRLVGVLTIDDMVEVIDEEAEEDLMRLGGVAETDISSDIKETIRSRFPWLGVNLATAILASLVIGVFEATLEAVVALAVLMPIVASMGGNAGTQTLTVAVRALAMKEIRGRDGWRLVGKELAVGVVNGALFALAAAGVAWVWFSDMTIGLTIAIAMVINLAVAGVAGAAIPLGLSRAGVDPAVASTVFLTTVTDVVGFFVFLGLAGIMLL